MHNKHDLFTEAFVLQVTYMQSFRFQLLTDLEILAFCFSSFSNNLKSLKIIKYRRNEKIKKSKDVRIGLKKTFYTWCRWVKTYSFIYLSQIFLRRLH